MKISFYVFFVKLGKVGDRACDEDKAWMGTELELKIELEWGQSSN